jgi:tight adherence protein B
MGGASLMEGLTLGIFLLLVFGSVFLAGYSLFVSNFGDASIRDKQVHQRLDGMAEDAIPARLAQRYLKEISPLEKIMNTLPGMASVDQLIKQAGYLFPAYQLILLCACIGILLWIAVGTMLPVLLRPVLIIVCLWLPLIVLGVLRDKRLEKFEEQMPDALDMITRALRAGHRFNDALLLVAQELPDPIGIEFATTFDELNYGMDMRIAFKRMQLRIPNRSLKALLISVLVQRDSGGNLAEILTKISAVIRGHFRFDRKVKTLTAEGRMSVWVLGLLPFVLFGLLSYSNPDYMNTLTDKPEGRKLILYGIGLMAVGILWVRNIVRIKM